MFPQRKNVLSFFSRHAYLHQQNQTIDFTIRLKPYNVSFPNKVSSKLAKIYNRLWHITSVNVGPCLHPTPETSI